MIQIVKSYIFASITCNKIMIGKKIFSKDFGPFLTHNLRGQSLFLDIGRKVLKFETIFVQQMFRNSWPFLSYWEIYILGAVPITPFWCRLSKKWKMRIVQCIILSNFCSIMLFKMFVIFEIYEVKNWSFWPLKSLIT